MYLKNDYKYEYANKRRIFMSKQKITKASICSCRNFKRILSAVLSVMLMITVSAGLDFLHWQLKKADEAKNLNI